MRVSIQRTEIPDVLILEHEVFEDERGFFTEVFKKPLFEELGLPSQFVQLNQSRSARHVLRGLHFQWEPPMGKLMRVTLGRAYMVAVDIRHGSPTLGRWVGLDVSDENRLQLWAPAGFARGFAVLSDWADVQYLCTGVFNRTGESGILWNDPEVGIDWPVSDPILSSRDASAQTMSEWLARPESRYFTKGTDVNASVPL